MLDGGFSYILGFAALAGLIKLFSKIKNDDKKLEFLFHKRETFLQINHYLKNTFNGKKFVTEKDIKSLSDKYKNITKLDIPEKMREKDENFYDLIIENKNYLFDLHGERLKNNEKFTSGSQKKYLNIFSNPKGRY